MNQFHHRRTRERIKRSNSNQWFTGILIPYTFTGPVCFVAAAFRSFFVFSSIFHIHDPRVCSPTNMSTSLTLHHNYVLSEIFLSFEKWTNTFFNFTILIFKSECVPVHGVFDSEHRWVLELNVWYVCLFVERACSRFVAYVEPIRAADTGSIPDTVAMKHGPGSGKLMGGGNKVTEEMK